MKVIRPGMNKPVSIGSVPIGSVFDWQGDFYLKINTGIHINSASIFSVNLETGLLTSFDVEMSVYRLDASVTIAESP